MFLFCHYSFERQTCLKMLSFCLEKYNLYLKNCVGFILQQRDSLSGMSDQLCIKCKKFFGNLGSLGMCSVCYKSHQMTEKVVIEATAFKIPQIPEPKEHKQTDHSRCFACKKKVGLLGTRCKSCDCSHCNAHRLPEDHKCEGNYIEMAKEEIKKNVTTVTAAKIEKI